MPVVEIVSEEVKDLPAARVGEHHVERDRNRVVPVDEIEYLDIADGDNTLDTVLMGALGDYFPEPQVVLDNEKNLIARLNVVSVVACVVDHLVDHRLGFDAFTRYADRIE